MRFCFYSGYEEIKGGYTTLLITLIKGLYQAGEKTVLLNYKNGLIERELNKDGIIIHTIDLRELNPGNVSDLLYPTDVLIVSKFHEYFNVLLKVNPKVIYYDINDFIGKISDYKFGIKLSYLSKKLILKLLNKNSLLFMDDTGVENIKSIWGIKTDTPHFLPIPIEVAEFGNRYAEKAGNLSDTINITYIGRSVKWKLTILKKIIYDCQRLKQPFKIHILVDSKLNLEKILPLEKFTDMNLTIYTYENLPPSKVGEFLIAHSDIHFGMGTTALHSAILGIPTILVDYSDEEFPEDYSYSWLFQTENFSLGKNLKKRTFTKGLSLHEIISSLRINAIRNHISAETFDYALMNHNSERVIEKLIDYSKLSTFRLQDTKGLIPYYSKTHQRIKKIPKLLSVFTS